MTEKKEKVLPVPCKWCGDKPLSWENAEPGNWYSGVECDNDECPKEPSVDAYGDGAIAEWNVLNTWTKNDDIDKLFTAICSSDGAILVEYAELTAEALDAKFLAEDDGSFAITPTGMRLWDTIRNPVPRKVGVFQCSGWELLGPDDDMPAGKAVGHIPVDLDGTPVVWPYGLGNDGQYVYAFVTLPHPDDPISTCVYRISLVALMETLAKDVKEDRRDFN